MKAAGLFMIVITYGLIGAIIVAKRIYLSAQLLRATFHNASLLIIFCVAALPIYTLAHTLLSPTISSFIAMLIGGGTTLAVRPKLSAYFDLGELAHLEAIRAEILAISEGINGGTDMILEFEVALARHCKSPKVCIQFYSNTDTDKIAASLPAYRLAKKYGWVTPQSITRLASSPDAEVVLSWLSNSSIGLYTAAPEAVAAPTLTISFSMKADECPFTWPEIQRLRNVTNLIATVLTRSMLQDQTALEARAEHLAVASRGLAHDLRNFITPVSSFLLHAQEHFKLKTTELDALTVARSATRSMTDYIEATLAFSHRRSHRREAVDVSNLFRDVVTACEPRALKHANQLQFMIQTKSCLVGDDILLQRLLTNLVCNAIDASGTGRPVILSATDLSADKIRIQVQDNGSGFAPEDIDRVFTPFFTTKNRGDDMRGFGLGLTICHRIVSLHQGTIELTSEPQLGTTVTIDLPRHRGC